MIERKTSVACFLGAIEGTPYGRYECYPAWDGDSVVVAMRQEIIDAGYSIEEPNEGECYAASSCARVVTVLS